MHLMELASAAQLLTTALMLLQTVNANPSLPQPVRDQAQMTAQKAITEATRVLGKPADFAGPSCTITSLKPNHYAGEVVVFSYSSANATKLEFSQDSSDVFPVPEGELLGSSGQYRKVVEKPGYHFLTMKATGAGGQTTSCSAMVNVY